MKRKKSYHTPIRILIQTLFISLAILLLTECNDEVDPEITYETQVFNAITDSLSLADSSNMVIFLDPGAGFDDHLHTRPFRHNPENGTVCILTPEPDSLLVYFKVGLPFNESYHVDGTYGISNNSIDSVLTLFTYSTDVGSFVPMPVYVQEVIHAEENIHSDILSVLCIYLNEDFGSSSVYTPAN